MSFKEKDHEGNKKTNKKAIIYFILSMLWIFAAICNTISSFLSFKAQYIGLAILDIGCAFMFFILYKRVKDSEVIN